MNKTILISCVLLLISINVKAIKVKFSVMNMSENIAEGTTGIFTSFQVYPNNSSSLNSDNLIDFPSINYKDIISVEIEESILREKSSFSRIGKFPITDNMTFGKKEDLDITQGNTYVFRLVLETKSQGRINLLNKSITTDMINPMLNCVKLNNLYRKTCHNCFQESIVDPSDGGFYHALDFTRVVELDIHSSNTVGDWDVRHIGGGNKNNCLYTFIPPSSLNGGDNPLRVCLRAVQSWRLDHPNHDPIILYLDLKSDFTSHRNHPNDLDNRLISTFGISNIYQPQDLKGYLPGDKRTAAQQNNWPSMGDLTGKIIVVLTGSGKRRDQYLFGKRIPGTAPVAFTAAGKISSGPENDFVFYNTSPGDLVDDYNYNNNQRMNTISNLGYINRTWRSTIIGIPGNFNDADYSFAVTSKINNVAVANIEKTFYPENGWQEVNQVTNPVLINNRIRSQYKNVTQAATNNILATDLIVEQGTHYRMVAGNQIRLKPGVFIKKGTDTKIRIGNCGGNYNYNSRQVIERLTQEEIDMFMEELNKDLYSYKEIKKTVYLTIHPNPNNGQFNINIQNMVEGAQVEIYDMMGNKVFSQITTQPASIINLKRQPRGVYLIKTIVGDNIITEKIIYQ